jgi:spore maturation protein CgeB
MHILSVVVKHYYNLAESRKRQALEPMYLAFTDPIERMGHTVDHFDHLEAAQRKGPANWGDEFVDVVKKGGYDVVFFQTACQKAEFVADAVREAARYSPIVAWNSDDDWAWEQSTRYLAPYFTFVFTTYPEIYRQNRAKYPNLRLSQWGCYDRFADFAQRKDLAFTFSGQIYAGRAAACRYLRQTAGLQVFGHMSGMVTQPRFLYWPGIRNVTHRFPSVYGAPIPFEEMNAIWNRSRISYTPMEASASDQILQVKSRTFEMGLSGTLMICKLSPHLDQYYQPGKEFVAIENLEDCVEKVRYYLSHESERAKIARAYHDRTKAEHLWQHRFEAIFRQIGLQRGPTTIHAREASHGRK